MDSTKNQKMISNLQNRYQISKTLCNSLIPIGKTEEYIQLRQLLEYDKERNIDYQNAKKLIDKYHKFFIDNVLSQLSLSKLNEYAEIYYKSASSENTKNLKELSEKLRKEIANAFKNSPDFKKLFKKEMITQLLPQFISNTDDEKIVEKFEKFTTYFTGFFTNRKNMYSEDEKSTAISYRCINQNLPRFLDNIKTFQKVIEVFSADILETINNDYEGLCGTSIYNVFTVDYFNSVLAQSGIERYKEIIGGYTTSDGTKVEGINEYINKYNQNKSKNDKIPNFKPLYKQILSDRESVSFIPEQFNDDNETLHSIYEFYNLNDSQDYLSAKTSIEEIKKLFTILSDYSLDGIYIKNDVSVTSLSNDMFGSWSVIKNLWNKAYDDEHFTSKVKNYEKYEDTRNKAYKSNDYFSLAELQALINSSPDTEVREKSISEYYCNKIIELTAVITETYSAVEPVLTKPYAEDKSLVSDKVAVRLIKEFLDSIKALERLIKPLTESGEISDKNELFYGTFTPLFDNLSNIDRLYDKVRNYVTKKPYSKEKFKLNFDNPQLLDGWDRNKEKDYRSILLTKNDKYYLAIIDKGNSKVFENAESFECSDNCYEKVVYKLIPGPNKMLPKVFFANSNIKFFAPSDEIMRIYKSGTFKKSGEFNLDDCHKLIEFYKKSISRHPDWSTFDYKFKETSEYNDISEFYNDVEKQGYKITFTHIPSDYIDKLVDEGKVYLFKIYNKDFSPQSKGTANLHTLYFKMLFDERNLENVVYKLNGRAEMFYRPASIKNSKITHPKNKEIENKNKLNDKPYSIFTYDLIKDKRFTKPQYSLHFPITMNFQAPNAFKINDDVRMLLKQTDKNCVIGIDRGERNLIYYSVINSDGVILEQNSLNIIENEYNGKIHKTNYHNLLDKKENERLKARQNWETIENIKELKNGYISQAVYKICQLVVKYDAVIVMEDLNKGFKNSRIKFEKQVYQKFEKMLIDKLNYLVDKKLDPQEEGGLLHAYQLTNKFESFEKIGMQNGIIFYIRPYHTSKIDPVTGFVNLLYPHYKSKESAKELISNLDSVSYNKNEEYFEFEVDYRKFPKCNSDYRKNWTICTYGDRIELFRNPDKNNEPDGRYINLTEKFISLFNDFSIDYHTQNIKEQMLSINDNKFFEKFMRLLSLTLQMRNSYKDDDYLISPVKDKNGIFFDSRNYTVKDSLPPDADANGAYNIARKGLWAVEQIKKADDISKVKLSISNSEWLKYAQKGDMNE